MYSECIEVSTGASAGLVGGSDILLIELRGVHTEESLRALRMSVLRRYRGRFHAFVIDYSRCVLAASISQLAAIASGEVGSLPGAIISNEAQLPPLVAHAYRAASRGVVRRVFNDAGQAMQWAQRQAVLHRLD
jgi:hypothetical protein